MSVISPRMSKIPPLLRLWRRGRASDSRDSCGKFCVGRARPLRHDICPNVPCFALSLCAIRRVVFARRWRPRLFGPRFSLRSLLGAVTFVSIALASLIEPWRRWCPAMVLTGLVVMMLLAIPSGIYARGRVRAYYVGFATVGWGYFLLVYTPWFETSIGRELLAYPVAESVCFAVTGSLGDFPYFLKVITTLSMFLLAHLGGLFASRFYAMSTEQSSRAEHELAGLPVTGPDSRAGLKELSLRRAQ